MRIRGRTISMRALIWRLFYVGVATRIPSWSATGKKLRVFAARGYCADVHPTANINSRARIDWLCTIGPHGGVGEGCILSGEVHVGPHVTMGPGCRFITGDHPVPPDFGRFSDMSPSVSPIRIEEDVFLGAGVTVLPGVTIGRGAAVGAASVVSRDVPPGAVVAGNPARVLRTRQV